jgi:hypothetical protein
MEPLDPKYMAEQIAERVLLLQSQIEAIKDWILSQPNAPTPKKLDSQLFDLESGIRNGQRFRGQSAALHPAIQGQEQPAEMLRLLYQHLLDTQMKVSDD